MAEGNKPKTVPGGRVKIEDKTRRCLECNEPLAKKHIDNVLYYICPNGCGRWAPNEKILRAREQKAVTMVLGRRPWVSEPQAGGGGRGKGKGSSKSGRKRKKPAKKKKPWEWD
ncbi:hypothetical protein [Phosphitispora fastidiosa]|uniref:hypothetical protein n=1 Tax=Phosphitispora fastidiosa TaxID=2837202 RepID=UPI001E4E075C|nr:hypothetical protein [Phosphitispora fastidiosa]MBU7006326.1 hypothetical protein [Phosphitispora fastidiosa]